MSPQLQHSSRMVGLSPPSRFGPGHMPALSMSPISPSIPQPNRYLPCGGRIEVNYGVVELPGSRNSMEDRTATYVSGQIAFFGVYDGHGGVTAADYCQDNLHKNLLKEMGTQWRETPQLSTSDPESIKKIS